LLVTAERAEQDANATTHGAGFPRMSGATHIRPAPAKEPRTFGTEGAKPLSSARLALSVFVAVEIFGLALYLVQGRNQWFYRDEWDFLAGRNPSRLHDLLAPHDEHWSTLPILLYRTLYKLVGLKSYVPYQLALIVLHLTAAALLRAVMRRAGVQPWIATAAASLFVLFGAANQDIVWAFQIGFVGALVFGLTQLLLADHDGPFDARDFWGLAAGAAALMCSGVGVVMVVVVGIATLLRRGWRAALFHTVPLAALFGAWFVGIGHDNYNSTHVQVRDMVDFIARGYGAAFNALAQVPFVGWLFGLALVGGLVLAWSRLPWKQWRRTAAEPAALLVGSLVYLGITAYGRSSRFGSSFATNGRYLHIVGALSLPALAVAVDAFARRWKVLTPVVAVALLVGVAGNMRDLANRDAGIGRAFLGDKELILTLPRVPASQTAPDDLRPVPAESRDLTIGWLRDNAASGRLPEPKQPTLALNQEATVRVSLQQTGAPGPLTGCLRLTAPVPRQLPPGGIIHFRGGAINIAIGGQFSAGATYEPAFGGSLVATRGPLALRISPAPFGGLPELCA
jgi:hypothetical protein